MDGALDWWHTTTSALELRRAASPWPRALEAGGRDDDEAMRRAPIRAADGRRERQRRGRRAGSGSVAVPVRLPVTVPVSRTRASHVAVARRVRTRRTGGLRAPGANRARPFWGSRAAVCAPRGAATRPHARTPGRRTAARPHQPAARALPPARSVWRSAVAAGGSRRAETGRGHFARPTSSRGLGLQASRCAAVFRSRAQRHDDAAAAAQRTRFGMPGLEGGQRRGAASDGVLRPHARALIRPPPPPPPCRPSRARRTCAST
jgi:hypothetical protein